MLIHHFKLLSNVRFSSCCTLTTNGFEKNSAGSAEVEWTAGWVDIATLPQVGQILDLISVMETIN